ncbi:hypothetical protein C809_02235 [Lachnospiraceae bacterium MD335]|nr:hypothetical protein C809_02235 [Lachnospiraceae bacterium MD335]
MALITEKPATFFDTEQIKRGHLLWGKHRTWNEGRSGFVTAVTKDCLTVQYYPGIGNVTNHFMIPISEAADGQWEIRWSYDMSQGSLNRRLMLPPVSPHGFPRQTPP